MLIKIFLFIYIFSAVVFSQTKIGVYGLQSPVGTKGFQNGKLDDIKDDVINVSKGSFRISSSIPMRTWYRDKYPNWAFSSYFLNYMEDMYNLSFDSTAQYCLSVFTPALYPIYADPPIGSNNDNDKENDRSLDTALFESFIWDVLKKESELVISQHGSLEEASKILLDPSLRPFAGWYLDDEPLIRNHDISVIKDMAKVIRRVERKFFREAKVFSNLPEYMDSFYFHSRRVAFDCDDLHKYKRSGRPNDAKFYNLNGKNVSFENNQIYTVFGNDVIDVYMLDFYHPDIRFWGNIISDFKYEFVSTNSLVPDFVPIVYSDAKREYSNSFDNEYYKAVTNYLLSFDIDELYFYMWNANDTDRINLKEILSSDKYNIQEYVK